MQEARNCTKSVAAAQFHQTKFEVVTQDQAEKPFSKLQNIN
jgi:hypothetical protein